MALPTFHDLWAKQYILHVLFFIYYRSQGSNNNVNQLILVGVKRATEKVAKLKQEVEKIIQVVKTWTATSGAAPAVVTPGVQAR